MPRPPKTRIRALPWLLAAVVVAVAAGLLLVRGTASAEALTTIDVAALHQAMNDDAAENGEVALVDVREPYEYAEGHVPGALSMPLAQVVALAADLPKDRPLYVICRSGNRSLQAAEALVEAGFQDVRDVGGGMISWQAAGYPVQR